MTDDTKGFVLERRAHRLAYHLGYFSRRDIILYSDEGNTITDIDVIGLKFDDILQVKRIIFETKSEKGFASILKIRGLLDYFGASIAYIIRPNITPDIIRFAEKIGINAFHTARLDEIEKSLQIPTEEWDYSYSEHYDYNIDQFFEKIDNDKKIQNYLYMINKFWILDDPFYNMKILIENLSEIMNHYKKGSSNLDYYEYFISEYFLMFILSSMMSAGELYKYPTHQRRKIFDEKLISGKISYNDKEDLLDKFYSFLKNYTKNLNKKMEFRRSDLTLSPPYSDKIYNIMNLLIDNSNKITKLPLYLDMIMSLQITKSKIDIEKAMKKLDINEKDVDFYNKLTNELQLLLFEDIPDLKLFKYFNK